MDFEKARFNMVEQQIRPWDVLDFDVLDALEEIPRERFVSESLQGLAYADMELPLANGHKMLEPKIVARLAQGLKLTQTDTVLEIGTGSGYATALLAKLAGKVVSDDLDAEQQNRAKAVLDGLALNNIDYVQNNGLTEPSAGAPFDAVYVGGAVDRVPEVLKEQLKDGGRMAVIVGRRPVQRALLITRKGDEFEEKVLFDTLVAHLDDKENRPFGDFDFYSFEINGRLKTSRTWQNFFRQPFIVSIISHTQHHDDPATHPAATATMAGRRPRVPSAGRAHRRGNRRLRPA